MIRTWGAAEAGPQSLRGNTWSATWRAHAAALAIGALLAIVALVTLADAARASDVYGPFGPEGPRLREQLWMLPSADHGYPLRATVFRPADAPGAEEGTARHPLVVINHGTSDATRLAVAMPVYYWLSRWFVERGYVVVLPQRRGHGATGGPMAESIGTCADPDHRASGLAAADDIQGAIDYMSEQPFVKRGDAIVVGISSGGWASLALASRNPENVRGVINIAGGRGGRPFGQRVKTVCGEQRLLEAARTFGHTAHVPTLWLYATNDSYFRPELASAMASAWRDGGGAADLHVFPPYGADGHNLADDRAGWDIWGATVESFLDGTRETEPVAVLTPAPVTPEVPPAAVATVASDGETRAP